MKIDNYSFTLKTSKINAKTSIITFFVLIYPLIVIPGPLDYFRGPRYIVLIIFSLFGLKLLLKEKLFIKKSIYYYLVIYVIFMAVSTVFANDPNTAWIGNGWRFTGFSTYLFCIILFLFSSNHTNSKVFFKPMILSSVIVAAIGLMQYIGVNLVPHDYYDKGIIHTYSTMGNSNWFGTYMVFILPAALLLYLEEINKSWFMATMIIYAGLLVSLTRGVWLVFIVIFAVITVVLYQNKELNKAFIYVIVGFSIVTLALLPLNDWTLLNRILSIFDALSTSISPVDESLVVSHEAFGRIYIWKEVIKIISEYPYHGIGLDNLRMEMPGGWILDKAHNIYLEIAVATGIFSLIAYIMFLSQFLRCQNNKTGFIILLLIITYLLQGIFNNDIIQVMPIFWIMLGLLIANNRITLFTRKDLN